MFLGIPSTAQAPAAPSPDARVVVGSRQRRLAAAVVALLVIGAVIATPYSDLQMPLVPGLLAVFSTAMVVCNLLLSALLFIKGRVEERGDTVRLAAAYLYLSLIIIPQTMSFPGALTPAPMIGTRETSLWFWVLLHVGFGLAVIRYAWLFGRTPVQRVGVLRPAIETVATTGIVTYITVAWTADLPPLVVAGHFSFAGAGLFNQLIVVLVTVGALASVARLRAATPEQLWLLVGMVASSMEVWLTLRGSARFTLGWYVAKLGSLLTSLFVLISVMHEITRLYSEAAVSNKRLAVLARRDGLTGLSNRRHFDEMIAEEFRRALRAELPLALIMVDVDFFKGYNDRYGHPAGDACLRRVSAAVSGVLLRPGDQASRYGGEEIAVLLPATDLAGAVNVANQILAAVAALGIPHAGSPHGVVTVSGGVASIMPFRRDGMIEELIAVADQALYQAKAGGRNRINAENPDHPPSIDPPRNAESIAIGI